MQARGPRPLLVVAAVALLATGCFESNVSDTTISGEITVGQGSSAQTVDPSAGEGTVTGGGESSAESSQASTGGAAGADVAAGKAAFRATCGGCHTLKDAGTTGTSAPDLDTPLTAEAVAAQIEAGGGFMPPKLLTGADAANVAAYVASVAGK